MKWRSNSLLQGPISSKPFRGFAVLRLKLSPQRRDRPSIRRSVLPIQAVGSFRQFMRACVLVPRIECLCRPVSKRIQ